MAFDAEKWYAQLHDMSLQEGLQMVIPERQQLAAVLSHPTVMKGLAVTRRNLRTIRDQYDAIPFANASDLAAAARLQGQVQGLDMFISYLSQLAQVAAEGPDAGQE